MSVDERLIPRVGGLITNLEDVGEGCAAVLFGQILKSRSGEVFSVKLAIQLLLSGCDGILYLDGGSSGCSIA